MNKIKIVHIAECGGGVDRFLKSLLKYSDRNKFELNCILSYKFNELDYKDIVDNISFLDMEHSTNPFYAICKAFQIRKLLIKYDPDIVVAHSSIAGVYVRLACIGLNFKVIYNPHGWSFNMINSKRRLFIYIEKFMSHFCNKIICISDSEKQTALQYNICSPDKLITINNGIDFGENINDDNVDIPNDCFVIGMVGRISLQKAPDIFVHMCSILKDKITNPYFLIVGDVLDGNEDEKENIVKLSKQLNVKINITGWVSNPINYMKRFDVGCLLSRWEGFGLVIPEFMYNEVPIVATKVDAIPYLITDNINGLLVEQDDYISAADKVLSIYSDKELKKKLIINGKNEAINKYNIQRTVKEYEDLYIELVMN